MASEAAPAAQPPRLHLGYVDGIRAAAALVVCVNHAYGMAYNPYLDIYAEGLLAPFRYSLVAGHLSVTVFIVVSGFCLALPLIDGDGTLRGGVRGFFKRRARRILPPYYAALALCLLLIATIIGRQTMTIWDVPIQVDKTAVISHLLLLQNVFGTGRINYVFWSIATEWHIYFFMPVFVWGWRRFGALAVVTTAMLVGYALAIGFGHTRLARANPHFLGMFTLGMLAAYIVRSKSAPFVSLRQRFPFKLVAVLALASVIGLIGWFGLQKSIKTFEALDFPVGIMATCLLVVASEKQSLLGRLFSFRPLVFVGTFSYSVYLVHAPLLQIEWQYVLEPLGLGRDGQFLAMLSVGLVLIVAASYAFHRVFEAPFMSSPKAVPKAALVAKTTV
jgi:peptidoglycan/LPS O-acetylase OafA/YrhL